MCDRLAVEVSGRRVLDINDLLGALCRLGWAFRPLLQGAKEVSNRLLTKITAGTVDVNIVLLT